MVFKKHLLAILVVLTVLFFAAFGPFYILAFINGIPLNNEVNPTLANGLITACGIFLGFLLTAGVSKSKDLPHLESRILRFMLLIPTAVFFSTMLSVFESMMKGKVIVGDLALLMGTLLFNAMFVAWFLIEPFPEKNEA